MSHRSLCGLRVLVTLPLDDAGRDEFRAIVEGADGTVAFVPELQVQETDVDGVSLIVGNVPARVLHAPEGLLWLQTSSAGYDHYLRPGVLAEGTALSCATGAYGQAVSEHMLAQALCLMKKLHLYRDDMATGAWSDHGSVTSLAGANVLVVGAGDIGRSFGELAHALGSTVVGIRRTEGACPRGFSRMAGMDQLFDLLPWADVVACALPSTEETRGLADERFFSACRRGAFFANVGRGDLVVTEDLVAALDSGQLAGAALDVTNPEPLPQDNPLWRCENALVTPHVAGFWHLEATTRNVIRICRDNLVAYVEGRPLENLVRG